MKARTFFIILFLAAILSDAENAGEDGPHLEITSTSGKLELDRASVLSVQLHNNASTPKEIDEIDFKLADARNIVAELKSPDDRIKVISTPQLAGSIAPGANKTVEFTARAQGRDVGIYPLQLFITYSRLLNVAASGDENIPDIVFDYEKVFEEIPLQAKVVRGPIIEIAKIKGNAIPGKESDVEILLANRGDEPVHDLIVNCYPQPPFLSTESTNEKLTIEPDGFAGSRLMIYTDKNTTREYYALPCEIFYKDGENRRQDLAVLVYVDNGDYFRWLLPAAVLLLLAISVYGLKRYLPKKKKQLRRRRS
jgi:hypothetical protein